MHVFSDTFVNKFSGKLINLHPSLPGTFTGLNCIEKQYNAMINGKLNEAGVMCHYIDSGIDTGEVIATKRIPIDQNINLEDFERIIHDAEHNLVVEVMKVIL